MDLPIAIVPLGQGGGIGNAFKSFWNQVSTWDFSILKWVLIILPIVGILIIVYFLISGKLCLFNTYFGQGYGLRLITGSFGAGKTKNVFQSAFLWKKENPEGILISNLKYDFVDFYFDSKKDFDFILKDLVQYIRDTNDFAELHKNFDFPPIKIIVDEAHLYLFARDFKGFTKDILLVLTQCRKREISIDFITQELGQIDVFIRRLCPYIEYFEEKPLGLTKQSIFYSLNADSTSMRDEGAFEEIESSYLLPFSWGPVFKPILKQYYEQRFLTKYVIGGKDVYATTESEENKVSYNYEYFKEKLHQMVIKYREPLPPKKSIFDNLFKKENSELQKQIIQAQKNTINELLKYVPKEELSHFSLSDFDVNNNENDNNNEVVERLLKT